MGFILICGFLIVVLGGLLWREIRVDVNLGDEGYLFYGVQQVLKGMLPIRDFRAYDPARYFWCALWCRVGGARFFTIRLSMMFVSIVSLLLSLYIVYSETQNAVIALLSGCLSILWMRPRHKQIEILFSVICCFVLSVFANGFEHPVILGAFGGICLMFGLNIALYFSAAFFLFSLAGHLSNIDIFELGAIEFVFGGIASGLAWLCVTAFIPGGLVAYLRRKILPILRRGTTNLALPKPWIWRVTPIQFRKYTPAKRYAFRILFTAIPFLCFGVLALAIFGEITPTLLVIAAIGLVYFHHVLSRADLGHIYQVMQPFILTVTLLFTSFLPDVLATIGVTLLILASIWLLKGEADFLFRGKRLKLTDSDRGAWFDTGQERLFLPQNQTNTLEAIKHLVETHSTSDDVMFAAPNSAGMLSVFRRQSAVYDTFPVYMSNALGTTEMLQQLKATPPSIVIISNAAIDNRQELTFLKNYAPVKALIEAEYDCILQQGNYAIYICRHSIQPANLGQQIQNN